MALMLSRSLRQQRLRPRLLTNVRQSNMRVDPAQHNCMPQQAILRIYHPMILVGEREVSTGHSILLQHIERTQSLANRQSVVQIAVDDQMRSCPLVGEASGIPFCPRCLILHEFASKLVDREVFFFAGELARHAEDAVVRDQCFEFTPQSVSLDPVYHIPSIY
jgi:hypothetical protein